MYKRQGLLPLAQSFDTIGWLTRDGATLQRVADWCLSYDGSESTENVYGESDDDLPWRFVVPTEVLESVEPATRAAFDAFLERLASSTDAPVIDEVSIGRLDEYLVPFRTVQGAEAWRNNGEWVDAHPDALGPAVADRLRAASAIAADEEATARRLLEPLAERIHALVADAILLMPTVPGPAPMRTAQGERVDAVRVATLRMTTPAAIAGLPSLSAPLLTVRSQLGPAPVGICVTSRAGTDIALVRLARRLAEGAAPRSETP